MSADEEKLLGHVPTDGSLIGNRTLLRLLRWPEDRYLKVREQLLKEGRLAKGPGKGGSVKLAQAAAQDSKLLDALRELGGRAGNGRLSKELGWSEARYFEVRDRLIDEGTLVVGPGRGGTVLLAEEEEEDEEDDDDEAPDSETPPSELPGGEAALYEPIQRALEHEWARHKRFKWCRVQSTARQGRKATGGKWSRPDLAAVTLRQYRYLPSLYLDVWSFEVKTTEGVDVTSVYEALAHARFATRAYLMFPWPGSPDDAKIAPVLLEAERQGIGVYLIGGNPGDFATWNEYVTPGQKSPEAEMTDEFIARQFDEDIKSELQQELR